MSPSAKKAFEDGDYRTARTLARQTLANADASDKAREGARAILKKTSAAPLAKYIFLLAAVLLMLLSVFWIDQGKKHKSDDGVPPVPAQSTP